MGGIKTLVGFSLTSKAPFTASDVSEIGNGKKQRRWY